MDFREGEAAHKKQIDTSTQEQKPKTTQHLGRAHSNRDSSRRYGQGAPMRPSQVSNKWTEGLQTQTTGGGRNAQGLKRDNTSQSYQTTNLSEPMLAPIRNESKLRQIRNDA